MNQFDRDILAQVWQNAWLFGTGFLKVTREGISVVDPDEYHLAFKGYPAGITFDDLMQLAKGETIDKGIKLKLVMDEAQLSTTKALIDCALLSSNPKGLRHEQNA